MYERVNWVGTFHETQETANRALHFIEAVVICARRFAGLSISRASQYSVIFIDKIAESPAAAERQKLSTAVEDLTTKLSGILVSRGLCDEAEAFACILPVLRRKGMLYISNDVWHRARQLQTNTTPRSSGSGVAVILEEFEQ